MQAIGELFKRLLNVHLLFWTLSFGFFDALPLFVTILTAIGLNDVLQTSSVNGVSRAVVLQFVLYILAFVFCYLWPDFRRDIVRIANNMICLSLTVSFLACLFVIVMQIFLTVSPLAETLGREIRHFANDLRTTLPWDSRYSFAGIFFVVSYIVIFINTLLVVGKQEFWDAIKSPKLGALAFSFVLSLLASFIVMWPVFKTMRL
jgi:hypothetical protein